MSTRKAKGRRTPLRLTPLRLPEPPYINLALSRGECSIGSHGGMVTAHFGRPTFGFSVHMNPDDAHALAAALIECADHVEGAV